MAVVPRLPRTIPLPPLAPPRFDDASLLLAIDDGDEVALDETPLLSPLLRGVDGALVFCLPLPLSDCALRSRS